MFKVGDKVKINCPSDYRHGMIGVITSLVNRHAIVNLLNSNATASGDISYLELVETAPAPNPCDCGAYKVKDAGHGHWCKSGLTYNKRKSA